MKISDCISRLKEGKGVIVKSIEVTKDCDVEVETNYDPANEFLWIMIKKKEVQMPRGRPKKVVEPVEEDEDTEEDDDQGDDE